jgi:hypothetical protein
MMKQIIKLIFKPRLAEKEKANQIDPIEYDRYSTQIAELKKKRAALNININL